MLPGATVRLAVIVGQTLQGSNHTGCSGSLQGLSVSPHRAFRGPGERGLGSDPSEAAAQCPQNRSFPVVTTCCVVGDTGAEGPRPPASP